ncbi:glycosyltransferase [Agromyces sp. SYSU K20354]|uniref:glycosyltransferase n=1 Tax=Agromyces cavernae TaxID=2898659 RepID=UPI001E5824C3|nr:glycosyltransferase [Agromyces cavernae]MCD2441003.1 glycosyltransferase [Agromyces cavernae]
MPEIILAHDYLLQLGGAERVVAEWAAGFGSRPVVTLAYRPDSTFDGFRQLDVQASIPHALAHRVEWMLPMLPSIAARTRVSGGDIALVSSSGWAHRFQFEMPHVVYAHSPARWLYAAEDYRLQLGPLRRAGLWMSAPLLRHGDRDAMRRASGVVSNSIVTRDRMRSAYGLDSVVVNPPVEPVAREAHPPNRQLPDDFVVVVSRDRGYKNLSLAVAAAKLAQVPIVIVGHGSAALDDPENGVHGLGRVTDAELCWVYRRAAVIIGAGREDFGLTIVEASLEGTPAATIASGGYLETVRPGVNGYHAASATPEALATAILQAQALDPEACREWGRRFSRDAHLARLGKVLEEVVQRA